MAINVEQIETMFEKMPERIREQVLNSSFDDTIKQLSTSYQFDEKQEGTLKGQTILLVAGLLTGEEFIKNIKDLANVDQKTAEIIFIDVTEFILNPIMDRYYYRETEEEEGGEAVQFTPEEEAGIEEKVNMRMKMKQALLGTNPREYQANGREEISSALATKPKSMGKLIEERQLEAKEREYQREPSRNLVDEKLEGAFGLPMKETDYSLEAKEREPKREITRKDPYRIEPV